MDWKADTIKEWRELGFYYHRDEYNKQWWIMGSKQSLLDLASGLERYANDPQNKNVSDHIHLGPYQYLKIMKWHNPIINLDCIGGTPDDLKHLKLLIERNLSKKIPGEMFYIGEDYAPGTEFIINFFVMANGFDPSSIDFR